MANTYQLRPEHGRVSRVSGRQRTVVGRAPLEIPFDVAAECVDERGNPLISAKPKEEPKPAPVKKEEEKPKTPVTGVKSSALNKKG